MNQELLREGMITKPSEKHEEDGTQNLSVLEVEEGRTLTSKEEAEWRTLGMIADDIWREMRW